LEIDLFHLLAVFFVVTFLQKLWFFLCNVLHHVLSTYLFVIILYVLFFTLFKKVVNTIILVKHQTIERISPKLIKSRVFSVNCLKPLSRYFYIEITESNRTFGMVCLMSEFSWKYKEVIGFIRLNPLIAL